MFVYDVHVTFEVKINKDLETIKQGC
jgi:hypothetical protein